MFSSRALFFIFTLMVVFANAVPLRRRAAHPGVTPPSRNVAPPPFNDVKGSSSVDIPTTPTPSTLPSPSRVATLISSSASATPPSSNGGDAKSGLLDYLFPVSSFSKSWTMSPASDSALALSDASFRPTNVLRATVHSYTNAPDGKRAMQAHYPQGSYTFGNKPEGGFSFYAPGPANVDLTTAKEATFGYSVFFPKGFAFNLGGKLPGLYGGNSEAEAIGCSGGRRSTACFSARLMWRTNGDGEFYTYLNPAAEANRKLCNVAPVSDCNPTYGASVGRGSFRFATGQWTTISERVRLNDVGKTNGELQLFVNGKSVINVSGLVLRDSAVGKIRGMQMQTFFGGSKLQFASPKDQDVYFSDFSAAITETLQV